MKKIVASILVIILMLGLASCTPVEVQGLDSYYPELCSVETTEYLFPTYNFINDYEYQSGDFFYYDSGDWKWGYISTLAYLKYSPEIYEIAKNYCLEEFVLADETREYSGYTFVEHIEILNNHLEVMEIEENHRFPRHFNMFAYNDDTCTLVFLGYYNGDADHADKELAVTDFGVFIDKTYSKYFSFE